MLPSRDSHARNATSKATQKRAARFPCLSTTEIGGLGSTFRINRIKTSINVNMCNHERGRTRGHHIYLVSLSNYMVRSINTWYIAVANTGVTGTSYDNTSIVVTHIAPQYETCEPASVSRPSTHRSYQQVC